MEGGFLPLLVHDSRRVFSFTGNQEAEEKGESDKCFNALGYGKIWIVKGQNNYTNK